MNERNDQLDGPYRVADVITIWTRIARMAEHLWKLGVVSQPALSLRTLLGKLEAADQPDVDHPDIDVTLATLAAPDGMCASDWLRMKVVDARGQTNVSLHALDLRGLQCRRLVVRFDSRRDVVRVTVQNMRGDFASVESATLPNALSGALRMAGARKEIS